MHDLSAKLQEETLEDIILDMYFLHIYYRFFYRWKNLCSFVVNFFHSFTGTSTASTSEDMDTGQSCLDDQDVFKSVVEPSNDMWVCPQFCGFDLVKKTFLAYFGISDKILGQLDFLKAFSP